MPVDLTVVLNGEDRQTIKDITREDVINNLTSIDTNRPLSAGQGKVLKDSTYTKTEIDNLNYTKAELDGGQLDNRYFTEAELIGAIGNINNPLLDLPLNNSLAMKQGVGAVTFTRTQTNPQSVTSIDRNGNLRYHDEDEPRFEKNGLLIEGASTNKLLHSNNLDGGTWSFGGTVTKTQNVTSPDSTANGWTLSADTTSNIDYASQNLSAVYADGDIITASVFLKQGTSTQTEFRMYGSLETGSVMTMNISWNNGVPTVGGTAITSSIGYRVRELVNGWYRFSFTFTVTDYLTRPLFRVYPSTNGLAGTVLYFGGQVEKLAFASSYIPTPDNIAITRSADNCRVTALNNVPLTDGITVSVDTKQLGYDVPSRIYDMSNAGVSQFRLATFSATEYQTASPNYNNLTRTSVLTEFTRFLVAMNGANNYVYQNGVYEINGANVSSNYLEIDSIQLGSSTALGANMYGHIKNFRIWDKYLTPAEAKIA